MSWAVATLTWNNHDRCCATLRAFRSRAVGCYWHLVLDNGSTAPFVGDHGVEVIRNPHNRGAGAGMSDAIRCALKTGADYILFLEDDWTLQCALHLSALEPILDDPLVGQARLAARASRPSSGYWTYALEGDAAKFSLAQQNNPYHPYSDGEYQLVRLLWSNNPFACRRDVAERFLLTDLDEIQMARPYLDSGLLTADTVPGYFTHEGEIKSRREETGWRK